MGSGAIMARSDTQCVGGEALNSVANVNNPTTTEPAISPAVLAVDSTMTFGISVLCPVPALPPTLVEVESNPNVKYSQIAEGLPTHLKDCKGWR